MPINPKASETEDEFIGRCMDLEKDAFPDRDQRLAVCYSYWENEGQQGGVVAQSMARTKFEYPPKSKEKLSEYMSRCMGDSMVKEKKPNRLNRANFCYRSYQDFYVMSIGKRWK